MTFFRTKLKPKKCKQCGDKFEPYTSLSQCCSIKCSLKFNQDKKDQAEAKKWTEEKKVIKDRLKSHSEWLNELQIVFNLFIRLRDKNRVCISCGTNNNVQYHAGHFYSVGAYPNLRFNEDNVHKQCGNNCNKNLHGNLNEYAEHLPVRIGRERFEALKEQRNMPLKLSIPEIKEKIVFYKAKIKELK